MNEEFFFDALLALIALLASGRMIYLALNHEAYFRKHKEGTIEYIRAKQLSTVKARIIAAIATPLLVLNAVLDGRAIVHTQGKTGLGSIEVVLVFLVVIIVIATLVGYNLSRQMKNSKQ